MIKIKNILIIIISINIIFCNTKDRIITIGGCVTETVFALDRGDLVIAVDQSSTTPEKVKDLPQVGYIRAIASEGILSMIPSKILTTTDMGPAKVIDQIKNSGVDLEIFKSPHNHDEILELIDNIASILNAQDKAKDIKKIINTKKNNIDKIKENYSYTPKIAFFMSPASKSYNAAGSGTRADYLIDFIGGENIFKDKFSRYRKVTSEEIINLNPDIILIGSISNNNTKINSFFSNESEFQDISAVKNNKIIHIDMGKYLSFGPSFTDHVLSLINIIDVEKK
tara:strand:- start:6907 stop:7752 length:846 start_codon:yes stop_codon:yes gene_type:complete